MVVVAGRQRRLLSGRDEDVLRWIGEQYLVPRDVLGELLGRTSMDETARAAGRVTDTVVDRTLRRWRDLGLAQCRRLVVGEAATVWPTRLGLRVAGLEYRAPAPSLVTLAHRHAVARVRARLEARRPDLTWTCERELRDGTRGRRAHIPDGVVDVDGLRWAIEVELTAKSDERVREILWRLFSEYDRVVYYATPRAGRPIRKTGASRLEAGTLLVRAYPLPQSQAGSPPDSAAPVTAALDAGIPHTEQPGTAPPDRIPPAVEPEPTVTAAELETVIPPTAADPGRLEQQALALTEAQTVAPNGVEDARPATGRGLAGIGRRRRRRDH
jgi:hypothetical protein